MANPGRSKTGTRISLTIGIYEPVHDLKQFLWQFCFIAFLRAADLVLTWSITPDLSHELNPVVRKLGWRRNIILNFFLCVLCALVGSWLLVVFTLITLVAIVWNARILWKMTH